VDANVFPFVMRNLTPAELEFAGMSGISQKTSAALAERSPVVMTVAAAAAE
jgi:hypothetical protein